MLSHLKNLDIDKKFHCLEYCDGSVHLYSGVSIIFLWRLRNCECNLCILRKSPAIYISENLSGHIKWWTGCEGLSRVVTNSCWLFDPLLITIRHNLSHFVQNFMLCHRCQGNKCDLALLYQDEFLVLYYSLYSAPPSVGGGRRRYPLSKHKIHNIHILFTFWSPSDNLSFYVKAYSGARGPGAQWLRAWEHGKLYKNRQNTI